MTYHALVAEFKRRLLAHALACGGGSVVKAARLLGVDPKTFYRTRSRLRASSRPGPRRCATCAHSFRSHRVPVLQWESGYCAVPGCQCERYVRAVPVSTTQQADEHRRQADTGAQPPRPSGQYK
jgi:transposase-like protein